MAKGKMRRPAAMPMPTLGSYDMPKPKIAPAPKKMAPRVRTGVQGSNNMAKALRSYRKGPKAG